MPESHDNRVDLIRPDAPPLVRGPHRVGVRTVAMTDEDRQQLDGRLADRALIVELWYPTMDEGTGCTYETVLRDGHTRATLLGAALRDARPREEDTALIVLSHGYPGNRHLMAHLGEALASHGYRVASIDHTGSTYDNKQAFAETLFHRPLDQQFVANALGDAHIIVGYSMGGYGALISGGAGLSETAMQAADAPPDGVYRAYCKPQVSHQLKGIVPIGPWGRQRGFWDETGLAALRVPMLLIAGSADSISGYETGMRLIHDEAKGAERWLLSFDHAGHNAAAPIPALIEAWARSPHLEFPPHEHYADPVWDTVRMNNIAAHYIAAFAGLVLRQDADMRSHLGARPPPAMRMEHRPEGA